MTLAAKYNLYVVEDAAQAIDSYYLSKAGVKKPLGGIGHLAAFSFHETKNIISGEGGMLVINDKQFAERAEIIWEKGTNRSAFYRGEVDKYGWVDIGSSFLPSEIIAAFLYAQLEKIEQIQNRRLKIWNLYFDALLHLQEGGKINLPIIPDYSTNNAHMFYFLCESLFDRDGLLSNLRAKGIQAVFHYQSLHKSPYFAKSYTGASLHNCDRYSDCLVRLPFYYSLTENNVNRIVEAIEDFYQ
jgi:dTDP-4-amino-4,6-dideoxygalactose transaminase